MSGSRPKTIAVCTLTCSYGSSFEMLKGVCLEAKEQGFATLIFDSPENYVSEHTEEINKSVFKLIDYDNIDGVIISQSVMYSREISSEIISKCEQHKIPIVSMNFPDRQIPSVCFDDSKSFANLVEHLITDEKGKDIRFVAGPESNEYSENRMNAFKKALEKHNLPFNSDEILYGDFWRIPALKEMDRFFASGAEIPDAFVCANDSMAIAVCEKLFEKGYSVPHDTIVTGFDGIELAEFHIPKITTAKCDNVYAGRESVKTMAALLKDEPVEKKKVLNPEILFRQSCGCAKFEVKNANNYTYLSEKDTGHLKYLNYLQQELATYVAPLSSLDEIKRILVEKIPFSNDAWIMLNHGFMDIHKDEKFTYKNPFDKIIDAFFCIKNGKVINSKSINRSEYLPDLDGLFNQWYTNFVFMPLIFGEEFLGYLAVLFTEDYYEISRYEYFAQTLSQVLASLKMREQLEFLLVHDPLTGIFNRRGFYDSIERFITENSHDITGADNKGKSLIVYSIDIDGLKQINDTYGHKDGDFAIKVLADAIFNSAVKDSVCARFGGDEFVCAAVENGDCEKAIEKFKASFQKYLDDVNSVSEKPYKISASCGARFVSLSASLSVEKMIAKADEMMYSEKSLRKRSHVR
ncbi:MAG: GGDEF domain-containing protein [Treponemataceae bacterium]|nr:GGDEF domain-containing protein [Treponemataceae bacterium]